MYKFVIYFLYFYGEKLNYNSRIYATVGLTIVQNFHLVFVVGVLEYFFGFNPFIIFRGDPNSKLYFPIIIIGWMMLNYSYYNQDRINDIILFFGKNDGNVLSYKNIFIFICILNNTFGGGDFINEI